MAVWRLPFLPEVTDAPQGGQRTRAPRTPTLRAGSYLPILPSTAYTLCPTHPYLADNQVQLLQQFPPARVRVNCRLRASGVGTALVVRQLHLRSSVTGVVSRMYRPAAASGTWKHLHYDSSRPVQPSSFARPSACSASLVRPRARSVIAM